MVKEETYELHESKTPFCIVRIIPKKANVTHVRIYSDFGVLLVLTRAALRFSLVEDRAGLVPIMVHGAFVHGQFYLPMSDAAAVAAAAVGATTGAQADRWMSESTRRGVAERSIGRKKNSVKLDGFSRALRIDLGTAPTK